MTNKLKKLKGVFFWTSTLLYLGLCAFYILFCLLGGQSSEAQVIAEASKSQQLVESIKTIFGSLLITYIIGIILTIFLKDKVRNTVWMANVILSVVVFGSTGMFITLGLWALDEFIFYALYKHYKQRYEINKEIDLRC